MYIEHGEAEPSVAPTQTEVYEDELITEEIEEVQEEEAMETVEESEKIEQPDLPVLPGENEPQHLEELRRSLREHITDEKKTELMNQEGDITLGVKIPDILRLSEQYANNLSQSDIQELMASRVHDERITALWILINKYKQGDSATKQGIYAFYLQNRHHLNSWDLVDLAARNIVGNHLLNEQFDSVIVEEFITSKSVWDNRSAVMLTHPFVMADKIDEALAIIKRLAHYQEELVQSSVGWVMKESYKRAPEETESFMKENFEVFSKQAIRIGTERMEKQHRKAFLRGDF